MFKDLNKIEFPQEMEGKVSELKSSIDKLNPGGITNSLPLNLQSPQLGLNGLSEIKTPGGLDLPSSSLPDTSVPGLPSTSLDVNSNSITEGIKSNKLISSAGEQAGNLQGNAEQIQQLKEQPIDKLVDSKVSGLSEVKDIQQASAIENIDAIKSQDAVKAELKKQVRTVAIDHFAGKEKQLKAAMDKISKYKAKYPSASSIADLKKKPANAMKTKPLIERIVPGVNHQILRKGDDILVDFNPYAGYKFTGRITAGLGWNQRVAYNTDVRSFHPSLRIYGPRAFGEFKLGKGFSPRLEAETMNTLVPPPTRVQTDPYGRRWVWGVFTGIKKEYKFIGNVKGTASVMVRLFDPKHQSPYADVVNARFGFEFPMKKKKS